MEDERNREEFGENGIEDMISLLELTEGNILQNLQLRYGKELIYTYTGSILVAVNPYKMFNIYGVDVVRKYEGQILGQQPPHLFAIGSASYTKMIKDNENQVIVISGESGAGKTESTKLIMQYLAAVNMSGTSIITERILEANPLLESFGNAKTIRNDNSSRFGKYAELYFKGGSIVGAKTSEYLLEKSRIVTQAADERNYHIFYEMLLGLSAEEKKKYGLQSADKYFYLNQGGSPVIPSKDDLADYKVLATAMNVLGLAKGEQETIFRMLASVLHVGNVYFKRVQNDYQVDSVKIDNDNGIKWVCDLLQLNEDKLRQALTGRVTEARGESILTPLTLNQAQDARDAIAKALYSQLFTWLVERVNQIVKGEKARTTSLAILDIFGFEHFQLNSFEQLCINYANETLQYYFSKHIFKLEQEAYRKERIDWTTITFHDNHSIIDLIAKKHDGIIYLLDEESNFPKGTDDSFLEKCHLIHARNSLYEKPRMTAPEFCIQHYAGAVKYSVKNFLDKNRDTLRSDVMEFLIQSKNDIISGMFSDMRANIESKTISKIGGFMVKMRPRTATVAASFNESLNSLLETMSKCHPWFVRCIKPNNYKAAMTFDSQVVLDQLRYTGMLETIRIRKLGYPIQYKFKRFSDRYFVLLGERTKGRGSFSEDKDTSETVLQAQGTQWQESWQIGLSKVFLKESLSNVLENTRNHVVSKAVVVLQQFSRGYLARKRYQKTRKAAIVIQSAAKGWILRSRFKIMRRGIVRAQAQIRMKMQMKRYEKLKGEFKRKVQEDEKRRRLESEREEREAQRKQELVDSKRQYEEEVHRSQGSAPLRRNPSDANRASPSRDNVIISNYASRQPHRQHSNSSGTSSRYNGRLLAASPGFSKLQPRMEVAHLEIPSELGYIFSKLNVRQPLHNEKNVKQTEGHVELRNLDLRLPHDVNAYDFSKYVSIYFKGHELRPLQEPLTSPFLDQRNDANVKDALAIFKLILRYMGDSNLVGQRKQALADYIVYKGESNADIRDEIYVQLVNQTFGISNEAALQKGWVLITNCLSCFPPSPRLSKYLLKYVSDHAYDGYKLYCQHKLLQCMEIAPELSRCYAPCLLEWKAAGEKACMALEAYCGDGGKNYGHVESWMTAEEFASQHIQNRNIQEGHHGWTVALRDESDVYECAGHDYLLDMISEMEIPPYFPSCKAYFLVSSDRPKESKRRKLFIDTPHHADNPRKMELPIEELTKPTPASPRPPLQPSSFFQHPSSKNGDADYVSRDELLSGSILNKRDLSNNPDLSKNSILNIRYVKRPAPPHPQSTISTLESEGQPSPRPDSSAPPLAANSKMNKRYVAPGDIKIDLPHTRLNNRYTIAQDKFFPNGDLPNGDHFPNGVQNGNVDLSGNGQPNSRYAKNPNVNRSSAHLEHSAKDQILRKHRQQPVVSSGRSDVSDLDRWVDDVFDRVLDGNVDELNEQRTLENRLKGGGDNPFQQPVYSTMINTGMPGTSTSFPVTQPLYTQTTSLGTDPTQQYMQQLAAQQIVQQQQQQQQAAQLFAQQQAAQQLAQQQAAAQQFAQQRAAVQQAAQQQAVVQQAAQQQAAVQQAAQQQAAVQQAAMQQVAQQQAAQQLVQQQNQRLAAQQLASQQQALVSQQVAGQNLLSPQPQADSSVILKKQLEERTLQNKILQMELESKRIKLEMDSVGQQSKPPQAQQPAAKGAAPQPAVLNFTLPKNANVVTSPTKPLSPPVAPKPSVPSQSPQYKMSAEGEIDESVPSGVKTLAKAFEKKMPFLTGQTRPPPSTRPPQPIRPTPSVVVPDHASNKVTFSESVQTLPEVRETGTSPPSPPPPAIPVPSPPPPPTIKSQPSSNAVLSQPAPQALPKTPPPTLPKSQTRSPVVVPQLAPQAPPQSPSHAPPQAPPPPPHEVSTPPTKPPSAPPPPPIQPSAIHEGPPGPIHLTDKSGRARVVKVGKIQWPPPQEESHKDAPKVGRLEISEKVSDSIKQSRVKRTPSDLKRHFTKKADTIRQEAGYGELDMKTKSKSIEAKLKKSWGLDPDELREEHKPEPVKAPELVKPAKGKRDTLMPPPPMPNTKPSTSELSPSPPPHKPAKELPKPPKELAPQTVVDTIPDLRSLEKVQTVLYAQSTGPFLTYTTVPWTLEVRKELFTPSETLENPMLVDLVFGQIVMDTFSNACIRIQKVDKVKMRGIMESTGVNMNTILDDHPVKLKRDIIDTALEWPFYFSRMFPVNGGRTHPKVHMVSVGHSGVRLLSRERDLVEDSLKVLETFKYEEIKDVSVPRPFTVQIHSVDEKYTILYSYRAEQLRSLIEAFCIECEMNVRYVRAIKRYNTHEPTLLSFDKGDIIKLTNKNMTIDRGWLYGSVHGRTGLFPEDYIKPVPLHELTALHLLMDKTRTPASTTAKAIEYKVNGHELTNGSHGYDGDDDDEDEYHDSDRVDQYAIVKAHKIGSASTINASSPGKYSMLEFAMLHYRDSAFREQFPTDNGSIDSHRSMIGTLTKKTIESIRGRSRKNKKGKQSDWTWKDQARMVKWTKDPIQNSLLKFDSPKMNKQAAECFLSIMRYMGDYPLDKGQKPIDSVYSILMSCHNNPDLADEVYCQLTKQTTNNRSTKPESEVQGWRLLCILSSYFSSSKALQPYLLKYLETAYNSDRPHHAAAQTSLVNLRHTFRYGGRKNVPSRIELEALTRGRNTKRQMCILPGGTPMMLNMRSSSVVQDAIEQVCSKLGVQSASEMEEFTIFYVIETENRYCPLRKEEYVFDITTELTNQKKNYYLLFQRTSWVFPLHLNRDDRYVDVMYNQCIPDYLDGYLLAVVSNTLPDHMKDEIAYLAALQIRSSEKPGVIQKQKDVQFFIPSNVQNLSDMKPQQWNNKIHQLLTEMPHMKPTECQKKFLEKLQRWPLFGSTFFNIREVNDPKVKGDTMLAINREGLMFLDARTHSTLVYHRFQEVLSSRRGNAVDGSSQFLEIKLGDLYQQKVLRLVTEQGADIATLIGQYIKIHNTLASDDR